MGVPHLVQNRESSGSLAPQRRQNCMVLPPYRYLFLILYGGLGVLADGLVQLLPVPLTYPE